MPTEPRVLEETVEPESAALSILCCTICPHPQDLFSLFWAEPSLARWDTDSINCLLPVRGGSFLKPSRIPLA